MNHIYRLCWNRTSEQWVPASELARGVVPARLSRKRVIGHRALMLSVLAASLGAAGIAYAGNGPMGGQIIAGSGQIQQVGTTTTISQTSPTLMLNWQSFNIAPNQTVDFLQPGSSAIAVNRIFSSTPSEIFGHLNANGQVWLINPNGILFGQGAQVNVGGLVASTLDLDDSTLLSDSRNFGGSGKGSVINQGRITTANGGYVALLGNQVSNQGVVTAQLGTVALGGGSAVTLTFSGNKLLHVQVDQSTLNNLAENRQLIVANGGQVIMTAGAKDALLASAVNNTGVVQAQTVQNHNGTITLLGGMTAGTVNVGGTLDASAPHGGNGGSIETSAANFNLANDAHVDASAPSGKAGAWLIDPVNLDIDSTAATTISNILNGGTSVTEQTTSTTPQGTPSVIGNQGTGQNELGDLTVDAGATINWSNASASLTLSAYNALTINAAITGAGGITLASGGGSSATSGIYINAAVSSSKAGVTMNAANGNLTIATGASIAGASGVSLATTGNFINQAGAGAVTSSGGRWLIYSTNPTLDTDDGLAPNFIQYNAPGGTTPAVSSGNAFLYSVAPTVTLTGLTGNVEKIYDGTTAASLTGANITSTGLINGDLINTDTGTYASANAGSDISVTASNAAANVTFETAGGIAVYGYKLAGSATGAVGTIDPKQLTASIVGDPTKVYDGTTTATLSASNYQISGFVTGQGATVNQPSSVGYADADASTNAVINATFLAPNFTATGSTNLNNYILPLSATGVGAITPAPVFIRGLLTNNKIYDGTTNDPLTANGANLYGVIAADTGLVTLDTSAAVGNFASPNVGNNLAVSITGLSLGGTRASDYKLVAPTGLTADITPKSLTVSGVTATDKVYNGNADDTLNVANATLNGIIGSDSVTLSTTGAEGLFGQSNVGSNLAVAASGFTLTGKGASNYIVTQPGGLFANITPAPLVITVIGDPTKIYDGTDAANLTNANFAISGFVTGQGATIPQTSSAVYTETNGASNAGTNIPVNVNLTASDFSPEKGTSLSNYLIPATVSGIGAITPAPLTGSIVNNPTKVYDGGTDATLTTTNFQLSGFVGNDNITVTQTSGQYASPNAGPEQVSVTSLTAGDYQAANGTLLSNYILPTTLSGWGTIIPLAVSMTINATINGPTKVYDGNTSASIEAGDFTLTGFVKGQGAKVNQTIDGQFASANVGLQPVSATLILTDFTADKGTDLANYTFPITAYGTGSITAKPLSVSIINNPTKTYDGTTAATLTSSDFRITGFVAGQSGTIDPSTSFNYASANANTGGDIITGSLTSNNYVPGSNTLMSNYLIATSASGPGTINKAPLFITGVYATNKNYDTTDSDTLNSTAAQLAGLVAGDSHDVSLTTSTTGTFSQSDAGNNLAVTASGFKISGSAASNYILEPITGLTANIDPLGLNVTGIIADSRTYNATTDDTLDTANGKLHGVLGNDAVTLVSTNAVGAFSTANVGNGIAVTTSGFSLTGAQAKDYFVIQPTGLTANITPAPLTATIIGDPTKPYDGTDSATLTAADYSLTGFFGGQSATIPQSATANYLSANAGKNVGIESTLVTSDFDAATGTNLANYILPTGATGIGTISPKILNLNGSRVYDAMTDAPGSTFGTLVGLNGDTFTVSGLGVDVLNSKDVGKQTGFNNLGDLTLVAKGSANANNYTLVGGTDTYTISKATLYVLDAVAQGRIYNGGTVATVTGATLTGVLGNDQVMLTNSGTGTFSSANVGKRSVTTDMGITGGDASNYNIVQPTGLSATITPLTINILATGVSRYYDGTESDNVTLSLNPSTPLAPGDKLTYTDTSALFSNANVGTWGINVTGIKANGAAASAGDYTYNTTAVTSATIWARPIVLTSSRVYDGTTAADATLFTTGGTIATGVANQTLTLTGSAVLNGKDVGTQGFQSLGTLALGNGTGAASNYTLSPFSGDSVTITPVILNLNGTRVYDALTDANGSTFGTLQGVGSETLTVNGSGTTSNKDVGTYTKGGSPNNLSITGLTLVGNGTTDANDYTLVGGTDALTITPLQIIVSLSAANKTYDGTDSATATLFSNGVLGNDQVNFASNPATFAGPNVGNGITVTATGITDSGADVGNYTLRYTSASTTANITPALITLTSSRTYDGTTGADASLFTTGGTIATGIGTQTLTLTGSGVLDNKDAGVQGFQSLGTLALGNATGLASNYTLSLSPQQTPPATDSVTINAAVLNLSGTRFYDANTDANGNLFGTLTGFNGDTFTVKGSGVTGSANVGAYANGTPNATFGLGTLTLVANGLANAGDYTLVGGTDVFAITPLPIALTATRVYDATPGANASLFTTGGTLAGLGGQTLTLTGSGVLVTKNVGTQQAFQSLGTLTLGNGSGLASNYTLSPISNDWVTITPLAITVAATGSNKTYDGSTTATVGLGSNGILAGDQVSFSDSSANFSSPNAGNGLSIAVAGISGSGADAGNYIFNTTATATANITPVVLNLSGARVYDGSTDANANLFGNDGVLAGINGQTLNLSGSGVLASKNVNPAQGFASLGSLSLSNGSGLASNYTLVGGVDQVAITPAILTVIGTTTTDRTYDGTTLDTLSGSTLSGVFGNDSVSLGNDGSGLFGDKNVGNDKSVSTAMTISGTDAGNYILEQPTGLVANITPLPITVNATGTNRMYNGKDGDAVTLSSTGVLAGDQLGFSYGAANFANPYVGNDKPVTVSGIAATGADAGNYLVVDPITTTEADITNLGFIGTGLQGSLIAQLQSSVDPRPIATPYGSAETDAVGVFIGNQKLRHRPIERNRIRSDFRSGMSLQSQNGGIQLPLDASP